MLDQVAAMHKELLQQLHGFEAQRGLLTEVLHQNEDILHKQEQVLHSSREVLFLLGQG